MLVELPDGRRAVLTDHALERWQEYVCPLASRLETARLLQHVIDLAGELTDAPPAWLLPPVDDVATGWVVAGDFVLVLIGRPSKRRVVTVVPRGSIPRTMRKDRNQRRRVERHRRAEHRRRSDRRGGDRARARLLRAPDTEVG